VFPALYQIGAHPTNNRYKTTHILYTNLIRNTFVTIRQRVAALYAKALESVSDDQPDHSISFVARNLLQASYRHCSIVVVRLYLRSFLCLSGEKVFSGN
jgi:hypothetical protein